MSDCNCHSSSTHSHSKATNCVINSTNCSNRLCKESDIKLCTDGIDDSTNKERTEKSLSHSTKSIDAVSLQRDLNILSLKESLETFFFNNYLFGFFLLFLLHFQLFILSYCLFNFWIFSFGI